MNADHSRPLVLVADDDADDRDLLRCAFVDAGVACRLEFVEDGEALLRDLHARARRAALPDLLILDLNMPVLDGRAALRRVQADPVLRSVPVVVCSTSSSESDRDGACRDGASAFFTKPVTLLEFDRLVRHLAERWLGKQLREPPTP